MKFDHIFQCITEKQSLSQTSANISTRKVTLKSIHVKNKKMRNKNFFLICPLFLFLHNQCSKISQKKAQMHKKNKNKPKPIEKLVKFYPKEIILMRKNNVLLFVSFGIMTPIYLHEWVVPTIYRTGRGVSYDLGHSWNMFSM